MSRNSLPGQSPLQDVALVYPRFRRDDLHQRRTDDFSCRPRVERLGRHVPGSDPKLGVDGDDHVIKRFNRDQANVR